MLTKSDLKQIKTIVQTESNKLDKKITNFQAETRKNFARLEKKMDYADKFLDIEDHLSLEPLSA